MELRRPEARMAKKRKHKIFKEMPGRKHSYMRRCYEIDHKETRFDSTRNSSAIAYGKSGYFVIVN